MVRYKNRADKLLVVNATDANVKKLLGEERKKKLNRWKKASKSERNVCY